MISNGKQQHKSRLILLSTILSTLLFSSIDIQAQALEEIVVTAQRREQSLQEVPISIEVFGGEQIQQQGYRDLEALALFSPTVNIDGSGFLSQEIRIRGFGTSGNTLTLEQAAPTFLDGVHFGRAGQIRTAFMDVERVEVLKGPQPVYFGLNATAGAFNISSRKPTAQWEGYVDGEYGSNARQADGAIGGPITETLGVRVAGRLIDGDGNLTDRFTGNNIGDFKSVGGRVILQWTPSEQFNATLKFEASDINKDPEASSNCLTEGSLLYRRNGSPVNGAFPQGDERSIYRNPPNGAGFNVPFEPLNSDCFQDDFGISSAGPFLQLPLNVREENSDRGNIDIRDATDMFFRNGEQYLGKGVGTPEGLPGFGYEELQANNGYLDLNYSFDNGMSIASKTAFSTFYRETMRDNSGTPFLLNVQNRGEDFNQYSTELRLSGAPEGYEMGGMNANFEVGLFYQQTDNTIYSSGPRANVRRGLRFIDIWEDQKWKSVFANFTLGITEDITLELGGRYTDLSKDAYAAGKGANWVFDVLPCESTTFDEFDPATCTQENDTNVIAITEADTLFLLPGANAANLWTTVFRGTRNTPTSWYSGRARAVGLTTPVDPGSTIAGPFGDSFPASEFDPQLSLVWNATTNTTFYARYAEAFKSGGFDTGVSEINPLIEDFSFGSEFSTNYEIGAKGTFMDGRGRYNLALFDLTFKGLQVSSSTGDPDNPFININAGKQRTRGLEFDSSMAVTDRLTLSLSGAILDGKMVNFPNAGCTDAEFANPAESGCDIIADPVNGLIDRSGTQAPDIPDWKFVLSSDYAMPIMDKFELHINAQGFYSDNILTDNDGFSPMVSLDKHGDMNVSLGFGDSDDVWRVSAFARNLFEVRPTYHPEFDIDPDGYQSGTLSNTAFTSYGVKFRYNFR